MHKMLLKIKIQQSTFEDLIGFTQPVMNQGLFLDQDILFWGTREKQGLSCRLLLLSLGIERPHKTYYFLGVDKKFRLLN